MALCSFQVADGAACVNSRDKSFQHMSRQGYTFHCRYLSLKKKKKFFGMILSHIKKANFFKTQVIQL